MPLFETWTEQLTVAFQDLLNKVINFVPNFVVAILIFIIGWVVGSVIGKLVAQVVRSLPIDRALRGLHVENAVNRAGYQLDSGKFLGGIVKWFVIIAFLIPSLDALGLEQVNLFLQDVLRYLPNVFVAVLILLVAAVIADVVQSVISGSARAAQFASASLLGTIAKWAIWIFAILTALTQLGVATELIQTLFMGVVVALSLAFGLAFGLGGQEAASRYIETLRSQIASKKDNQ